MKNSRKNRTRTLRCLTLLFALFFTSARAGVITIPDGTAVIEAEAFAGCGAVNRIRIPETVTEIGEDAFAGCGEAVLIEAAPGSAAAAYAAARPLDWQADTQYRALIICQTYAGTRFALEGTAPDRDAMRACLGRLGETPYTVQVRNDLDPAGMLEAIGTCFAGADETDVSLLYYNGHGAGDGSLIGADAALSRLSPGALRNALDAIPGRKVVLVDACYSGKIIGAESEATGTETLRNGGSLQDLKGAAAESAEDGRPGDFVNAFRSAFRTRTRGGTDTGQYFIITASQGNEASYETHIRYGSAEKVMGIFTYVFCRGCGWNGVTGSRCNLMADANGDQAVSIGEAWIYAMQIGQSYPNIGQTAEAWPAECGWFAPFRR